MGKLAIEITGLPEGVEADVRFTGAEHLEVAASGTLTGVAAGGYAVTAARVYDSSAIVRTAFDATVTTPDLPGRGRVASHLDCVFSDTEQQQGVEHLHSSKHVRADGPEPQNGEEPRSR